ncbi:MAG: Mg2+/Co2+ transporter CorB [Paracoccaceae bacterium]|jgi:Mg2+/Co2+ transporter CorB
MTPDPAPSAMEAAVDAASAAIGNVDASIWWSLVAIVVLLVCSAFFSGSETALTASSRAKLHGLADKGDARAGLALRLTDDAERLIGAILLGNNLVNILAASLATSAFTVLFGESGVAVATIVMTLLVLIFAEVAPKTYAITAPEAAATRVAPAIAVLVKVLAPVVGAITVLVRVLLRMVGVRADPNALVLAHEEIRGAIDLGHSEGAVEKDDRDRLLAALDLRHREVSEVMAHRRSIEAVDANLPPREILAFCLGSSYTRIPLWKDEPENIVGVIHAKDLLRAVHEVNAAEGWEGIDRIDIVALAMEPWFVPDTTSLDDQMRAFLKRRSHFALVVDEYGDLQGLLTLEDILEEIVGDISDEHDAEVEGLERLPDGSAIIDGSMTIRDVNRACEWSLPDEEANTVAGLVIHEAQAIPSAGQIFSFHGFRFEVMERTRNQISKLKVKRLEE